MTSTCRLPPSWQDEETPGGVEGAARWHFPSKILLRHAVDSLRAQLSGAQEQ